MSIQSAIYAKLYGDATILSYVSDNIFPTSAPQGTRFPFIVFNVISITPTNTKREASTMDRYRIQVTVYDTDYDNAMAIKDRIRTLLENILNTTISGTYIQTSTFQNELDGVAQLDGLSGVFYFIQDYYFFITR